MQMAEALVSRGVDVDIFYDMSHPPVVDNARMSQPHMRCLQLKNSFKKLSSRKDVSAWLGLAVEEVCALADGACYGALVGVEKTGLAVAFLAAKRWRAPLFYWSLELYDAQHHGWCSSVGCYEPWLEMETLACKTAQHIIIQDNDRALALASATGIPDLVTKCLFLPVAIGQNEVVPQGSTTLHDICGVEHSQKILLQFGYNRMPIDWLPRIAESLPEGWMFVLHGLLYPPEMQHPKLRFSTTKYSEDIVAQIVASASIGLVHYENHHINDALTVNASEKLARYLAAGIPVLAHDIGNFSQFINTSHAGLTYETPEQLGEAVLRMEHDMHSFCQGALHAGQDYIFENVGKEVANTLALPFLQS